MIAITGALKIPTVTRAGELQGPFKLSFQGKLTLLAKSSRLSLNDETFDMLLMTTKEDWMKQGLQGRCISALTEELVVREREQQRSEHRIKNEKQKFLLWVHCVEEINGEYWRRRGWVEIRKFGREAGTWGSSRPFSLLVMIKEIDIHE